MRDPLGPAFSEGLRRSPSERGFWGALALLAFALAATAGLFTTLVTERDAPRPPLSEAATPAGEWSVGWSASAEAPAVEQVRQVRALGDVASTAAALVAALALASALGLWRERGERRLDEAILRRALGARRVQVAAHLLGEGGVWLALTGIGCVALALLTPALLEATFPGDANAVPRVAAPLLVLSGLVAALLHREVSAGKARRRYAHDGLADVFSSLTLVVAVGVATLNGVGLLVRHAPAGGASPGREAPSLVLSFSLSEVTPAARGGVIADWSRRLPEEGLPVGVASAGSARGVGPKDVITVDCGRCYEGGLPLPVRAVRVEVHAFAPDTFRHVGLRVVEGRDFDHARADGAPGVAIVSESLARRHFEAGRAIGRRVRFAESEWLTVVGVASDRPDAGGASEYDVYLPVAEAAPSELEILGARGGDVGRILATRPSGTRAGSVLASDQVFAVHRWFGHLLAALGLLTVVLVAISVWVVARSEGLAMTYEVGLRKALGARPRRLARDFAALLGRRVSTGVGLGLWLSLFIGAGLGRAHGALPQWDPAVGATVSLLVGAVVAAGYLPAFRAAARAAPVRALNASR